eukprot:874855-Prorocentrum_minimum.AAC.2
MPQSRGFHNYSPRYKYMTCNVTAHGGGWSLPTELRRLHVGAWDAASGRLDKVALQVTAECTRREWANNAMAGSSGQGGVDDDGDEP